MSKIKKKRHKKAIVKAITWRCISICIIFTIAMTWSYGINTVKGAVMFTTLNASISTLAYYFHELCWQGKWKK